MFGLFHRHPLVLALVFALLGGGATLVVLAQPKQSEANATEPVIVVARGIAAGERLNADDLRTKDVAKDALPADAVRDVRAAAGAYAATSLMKGEPVLRSKLSDAPPGSRLAAVIPEGRVAISVAVNDVISTGGFVAPGDQVDVLAVLTKNPSDVAALVLRDIRVLAVANAFIGGDSADKESPKRDSSRPNPRSLDSTVTLAVTIEEAQRLVQADQVGTLRLALRRRADAK